MVSFIKSDRLQTGSPMLKAIIFDMEGVIVDTEFLEYDLQTQFIEDIKERDRILTPLGSSEV